MTVINPSENTQDSLQKLKREIERKSGKNTEQLYEEREKRVREAIQLKEPDRVPLFINASPAAYLGISKSAAYYDPLAWKLGIRQIVLDFEPDLANVGFASPGPTMDVLEVKNRLWPGGPLPADYDYQFIEGEYMKEDEYDMFINDPTDFMLRRYLPRVFGALAPLSKMPPVSNMFNGFEALTTFFDTPEFEKMAKALAKAGTEMRKFRESTGDAAEELAQLGFPPYSNSGNVAIGGAPFDAISSALRGMKGCFVDMYRQPDKLLRACDVLLERRIARSSPADPKKRGNPKRIGMPLWRGDKVFMSDSQFKQFYWPGLKKAIQAAIDLGYVPMPFFEAEFGDRLECLLELPKGKVIAVLEHMDVLRAKEILKNHTCILGKGPLSLRLGSLNEFANFYKLQMDICKPGGGYMMSMGLPNGTREDIQAMLNSLKEYGRY